MRSIAEKERRRIFGTILNSKRRQEDELIFIVKCILLWRESNFSFRKFLRIMASALDEYAAMKDQIAETQTLMSLQDSIP